MDRLRQQIEQFVGSVSSVQDAYQVQEGKFRETQQKIDAATNVSAKRVQEVANEVDC